MMGASRRLTIGVAISLVGGCSATTQPARGALDQATEPVAAIEPSATDPLTSRTPVATSPPSSRSGRGSLGFVLESVLRARRIRHGQSITLELGNGAEVIDGDRLQVAVVTSRDAFLYLAFCSRNATDPRYSGLQVFPRAGALRVPAQQVTIIPDKAAEIVLDNQPGRETLYLILSGVELSTADSELANVIAAAGQRASPDCGIPKRMPVVGARIPNNQRRVWNGKSRRPPHREAPPTAAAEPEPVVEIQRGGDIVWNNGTPAGLEADADGIVILRYSLTHLAAP